MELVAITTILLCAVATAAPNGFYYNSGFPPYHPIYHQRIQTYRPNIVPIPLLYSYPAPQLPYQFPPAIPTRTIYSPSTHMARGFSYEMDDNAGGRSQVLYITGPNSQQLFRDNANILHLLFPKISTNATKDRIPLVNPTFNYYHAQVIPQGAVIGTLPLFTYTFTVNNATQNETKENKEEAAAAAPEVPTDDKQETDQNDTSEEPVSSEPSEETNPLDNKDSSSESESPSDSTESPVSDDTVDTSIFSGFEDPSEGSQSSDTPQPTTTESAEA